MLTLKMNNHLLEGSTGIVISFLLQLILSKLSSFFYALSSFSPNP